MMSNTGNVAPQLQTELSNAVAHDCLVSIVADVKLPLLMVKEDARRPGERSGHLNRKS